MADPKVLDAMMADLGNDRLEEFASDDRQNRRLNFARPSKQSHTPRIMANPNASGWKRKYLLGFTIRSRLMETRGC